MCCKYYSFDLIIALAYLKKKKIIIILYISVVTHNLTYIEKGHSIAADCNIAKVIMHVFFSKYYIASHPMRCYK